MAASSHVLVLPFPVQGHINPMLQFSKRLASKGIKVTLITTTSTYKSMQSQATSSSSISLEPVFDGVKEGEPILDIDRYTAIYEATVPKSLAELISKHNDANPLGPIKAIVYDSVLPWASEVASSFGIDGVPFFTQNCVTTALYYHKIEGGLKLGVPLEETKVISLPFIPELGFKDLPSIVYDEDTYPAINVLVLRQFLYIQEAKWLLWNTFNELEDELVKWMASKWRVIPIGPTIPSMFLDKRLKDDKDYGLTLFKPNSETCMQWLDSKAPASVVYVSFGSLAALNETQMAELAFGLGNCNKYFLWVVRETEEQKLPSHFKEESPEKGLIVKWSPQLQVLAHKSVGCFMTHCGWNSTLEALSLGVPMVAMPQWSDQPTNAKFIADVWRVGVRVNADQNGLVTKEEIERCIREVMEGEKKNEYRTNSEKWKNLAKEAVGEGGSSDRNIEKFVTSLECQSNESDELYGVNKCVNK